MAALLKDATRQLRGAWPLRYTALATDQSYRLTTMESGDVGCAATSAQRNSVGGTPGMTALFEVVATFVHREMVALGRLPSTFQKRSMS